MNASDLYLKFITNSREPQIIYFEDSFKRNSMINALRRLKKNKKETFSIKQSVFNVIIYDKGGSTND